MIQLKRPYLKESLLEFKNFADELYGENLEQLVLFGSQARGDATVDSDVDILIVTHKHLSPGEREKLISFISDLSINKNILINFIEMLPQKFNLEQSPLLFNIRREGIVL